jgi:hypothetical protein
MSQKKDGHGAGTKYVVGHGHTPKKMPYVTTNHRFTLLPITSASGKPVICVIIYQSKLTKIILHWASGIDTQVEPVRGSDGRLNIDGGCNFRKDKYFPEWPSL